MAKTLKKTCGNVGNKTTFPNFQKIWVIFNPNMSVSPRVGEISEIPDIPAMPPILPIFLP